MKPKEPQNIPNEIQEEPKCSLEDFYKESNDPFTIFKAREHDILNETGRFNDI